MEGILHSIESLAAVDGEGVRCCFFLAGCPLRCAYCHNPDTWQMQGRSIDADSLVKKVKRYQPYFGTDGGVTFSGGEPLLQATFIRETVPRLEKEGIPYILDTSGQVPLSEDVCYVLEHSQSILLDLKFWDDLSYRKYTGKGIRDVLAMLDFLDQIGKSTVVRTVVIPGINDSVESLTRYLPLVKGRSCIKKYELLPFHTMGFFKYEKLGLSNPFSEKKALSSEVCKSLQIFIDKQIKNG